MADEPVLEAEVVTASAPAAPVQMRAVDAETLIARIKPERALQEAMIVPALAALQRKGAVVAIGQGKHVTKTALAEIASYMSVDVEVTQPAVGHDPLNDAVTAVVQATAIRSDGVRVIANGVVSVAETQTLKDGRVVQRWDDWHAMCSMAETRAYVRATSALFQPIIQAATNGGVSATPAEIVSGSNAANSAPVNKQRVGKKAASRKKKPTSWYGIWTAWQEQLGADHAEKAWLWPDMKDNNLVLSVTDRADVLARLPDACPQRVLVRAVHRTCR